MLQVSPETVNTDRGDRMTTKTKHMTANELAQDFHSRGLNGWLSLNRTQFLRSLSMQDRNAVRFDPERHTYHGQWEVIHENGTKDLYSWSLYISPLNRCGNFSVKPYTNAMYEADKAGDAYNEACRVLNASLMPLMQEGRNDEVRQLLADFGEAWKGRVPA